MAFKDKFISNPKTGQDIRFLVTANDSGGSLLEMETTYHSRSKEPAAHYHPYQEEDFTVISGELCVRLNDGVKILRQGESLKLPANTVHSMWNDSDGKTVVNWQVRPALDTEYFLETALGLAAHGKTSQDGMPPLLQLALTANRYANTFRLARPPFAIQKLVFTLLAPFAYLRGFRPSYKKYLD